MTNPDHVGNIAAFISTIDARLTEDDAIIVMTHEQARDLRDYLNRVDIEAVATSRELPIEVAEDHADMLRKLAAALNQKHMR